ncbi:MAG: hypothetical protein V2A76_03270 [Planctomycetota bacterium]
MPSDEPLHLSAERISAATGLEYLREPDRAFAGPDRILEVERSSVFKRAHREVLESGCFNMLRQPARTSARGAVAVAPGTWSSPVAYDSEGDRILMVEGSYRGGRRADLARTEALALALLDQHVDVERRLKKLEDQNDRAEGLLGTLAGAAHAATLEASITPVLCFDASAAPIRRIHRQITERLLADPDGAPAELLVDPDLPGAERKALLELLETEGAARRRAILRVFAGARLVLQAKDRMTTGNLPLLFQDIPLSSEQLLHPERYLEEDDPPLEIKVSSRDGLAGRGFAVQASGTAGEIGLRNALEGALLLPESSAAAKGWGGDCLTIFRDRESEALAYAWRLEFDDRFEAMGAAAAFRKALAVRFGGAFEESAEGAGILRGGSQAAALRREKASLAVMIGGHAEAHTRALVRLLAEPVVLEENLARKTKQDLGYRVLRAVASPFLYDAPGRNYSELRSFFGVLFKHRSYPSGAEHSFFNPSELPLLGAFIPDELSSLLFGVERSPHRNDTTLLAHMVRVFSNETADSWRLWSPFFSYSKGPEYRSFGSFYGFLYEQSAGAGREALSPRLLWSHESGLDGQETETGVLLDSVAWRNRQEVDRRLRLLPFGALMQLVLGDEVGGMELGFLLQSLRVRSRGVFQDAGHFEFSLLYGWLLRAFDDDASGNYEFSVAKGLLLGAEGGERQDSAGLFRILGHSFLGWGNEDGRNYFDILWLRFGGDP